MTASSPAGSQPTRLARARSMNRSGASIDQRRDGEFVLPGDPERRAARDEDPTRRRGVDDGRDLVGRGQQVLHVVEDEDHRALGDERGQGGCRRPLGAVIEADRVSDRRSDLVRFIERREVHEPRPVAEPRFHESGQLDGETGLADPARAGQRDQPCVPRHLLEIGQLAVAADERGELDRAGCRFARSPFGAAGSHSAGRRSRAGSGARRAAHPSGRGDRGPGVRSPPAGRRRRGPLSSRTGPPGRHARRRRPERHG